MKLFFAILSIAMASNVLGSSEVQDVKLGDLADQFTVLEVTSVDNASLELSKEIEREKSVKAKITKASDKDIKLLLDKAKSHQLN